MTPVDFIQFTDLREEVQVIIGSKPWITVYESKRGYPENGTTYSAFIPTYQESAVLEHNSWDLRIGDHRPGFSITYNGGGDVVEYESFYQGDKIAPLVILRDFHSIKENTIDILEEFRLYHNLYYDRNEDIYYAILGDGSEEEVIKIKNSKVEVRLKYISSFISAKQCLFAIYFDLNHFTDEECDEIGLKYYKGKDKAGYGYIYGYVLRRSRHQFGEYKYVSHIMGKKIITPPARGSYGGWPFEHSGSEEYESFVIGESPEGDEIKYTSNPESLANSFGANPDAPQYLTPVYFRNEVMSKYYSQPEKYSIQDGYLSCGELWGLRLDNNHDKYVVVFLGDLGRDLPDKEQKYWRSFNIVPEGGLSDTTFKRDMLGEFADPTREDLLFIMKYRELQEKWFVKYRWRLHEISNNKDQYVIYSLRIPMSNDQRELDDSILFLTKIMIDFMNEKELFEHIEVDSKNMKGIKKLEMFLAEQSINGEGLIRLLRNLQELRSKGSGHKKGRGYDKLMVELGYNKMKNKDIFIDLLRRTIQEIASLIQVLET